MRELNKRELELVAGGPSGTQGTQPPPNTGSSSGTNSGSQSGSGDGDPIFNDGFEDSDVNGRIPYIRYTEDLD